MQETAADLAVALAVVSSYTTVPVRSVRIAIIGLVKRFTLFLVVVGSHADSDVDVDGDKVCVNSSTCSFLNLLVVLSWFDVHFTHW